VKKLVNGVLDDLTEEEIIQRKSEEAAALEEKSIRDAEKKRQKALSEKWKDPFDLIDDILERGIEAVKSERKSIKEANKKEKNHV